jgi:hypothetical protein
MWMAGYRKEQARLGVHDEVIEAVDAVVPGSIRYKKGMRTLNHDEARSIFTADGHRTLSHALAPLPGLTPILILAFGGDQWASLGLWRDLEQAASLWPGTGFGQRAFFNADGFAFF